MVLRQILRMGSKDLSNRMVRSQWVKLLWSRLRHPISNSRFPSRNTPCLRLRSAIRRKKSLNSRHSSWWTWYLAKVMAMVAMMRHPNSPNNWSKNSWSRCWCHLKLNSWQEMLLIVIISQRLYLPDYQIFQWMILVRWQHQPSHNKTKW